MSWHPAPRWHAGETGEAQPTPRQFGLDLLASKGWLPRRRLAMVTRARNVTLSQSHLWLLCKLLRRGQRPPGTNEAPGAAPRRSTDVDAASPFLLPSWEHGPWVGGSEIAGGRGGRLLSSPGVAGGMLRRERSL